MFALENLSSSFQAVARYEFFQEFGLMKQPLVKEVEMTETLKCLFGAVNRATGPSFSWLLYTLHTERRGRINPPYVAAGSHVYGIS